MRPGLRKGSLRHLPSWWGRDLAAGGEARWACLDMDLSEVRVNAR